MRVSSLSSSETKLLNTGLLHEPFKLLELLQVSRWFVKRAQQIDQVTGSLSMSVKVIDAGLNFVGEDPVLKELREKAEELQAATSIGEPYSLFAPFSADQL